MSVQDLSFYVVSSGDYIYDPLLITNTPIQIQVSNLGSDDLSGLGIYMVPATNVGDVDNPSDNPPYTDYQDLLAWGTASDLGLAVSGGLKIDCPTNTGTFNGYVTRTQGSKRSDKIDFQDLTAGSSATFTLEMETPPGVTARRFYVDLRME